MVLTKRQIVLDRTSQIADYNQSKHRFRIHSTQVSVLFRDDLFEKKKEKLFCDNSFDGQNETKHEHL